MAGNCAESGGEWRGRRDGDGYGASGNMCRDRGTRVANRPAEMTDSTTEPELDAHPRGDASFSL